MPDLPGHDATTLWVPAASLWPTKSAISWKEEIWIEKVTPQGDLDDGAGAIRSYSHAENTGLVISDGAKIGRIFETSKFLSKKVTFLCYFHVLSHASRPLGW